MNHDKFTNPILFLLKGLDDTNEFLTYQLSMVVYWTTMVMTGNGEFGFDSGEKA